MEATIYHNPKCSKSRETLNILKKEGLSINIIEYLKQQMSSNEIRSFITLLGCKPHEVLRKKEFKALASGIDVFNEDIVIDTILKNPIILERPIVIINSHAVIGRPPETVYKLMAM